MITRSEKIKAGIFFVIGISLFVFSLSFLGYLKTRRFGQKFHSYFTGVKNLQEGAPVKYNGVQVGRVTDITIPEPGEPSVRVEYLVGKPRLVTSNTCAQLTYISYLAGQQGVSLAPRSTRNGKEVKDRGLKDREIPTLPSDVTMAFETLLKSVRRLNTILERNGPHIEDLLNNTNYFLRDMRTLVSGTPQLQDVSEGSLLSISGRLDELVERLNGVSERLDETLQNAQQTLETGDEALGTIESLSREANATLDDNKIKMSQAIDDFSEACKSLRKASQSLDMFVMQNQATVNSTMRNLLATTQDLQKLLEKIRSKPSLLIHGPTPQKRQLNQ